MAWVLVVYPQLCPMWIGFVCFGPFTPGFPHLLERTCTLGASGLGVRDSELAVCKRILIYIPYPYIPQLTAIEMLDV